MRSMAESPVSALDSRQRRLLENAQEALASGCFDYAAAACGEILETVPGCVAVRRIQCEAWIRRSRERLRCVVRLAGRVAALQTAFWRRRALPEERLRSAERVLAADPAHRRAWSVLADAARALGLPETAVFARETLRELAPDDRRNLLALGEVLLAVHDAAAALAIADAVLAREPGNATALELMRSASVAETMTRGGWEREGSFREKLKQGGSDDARR